MKVKPIVCAIFYLEPILAGYSQVTWFPTGAKWHYELSSMMGGGLTTLEVLSEDTLIGNNTFKKIISKTIIGSEPGAFDTFTEVLYVFEENKVVVGYDKYSGTTLLYDFNATVGDTLGMYFGGLSPAPFIVDSIGEMEINGSSLAFQDIRFPNLFEPGEYSEMRVIEGMGSISSHLFHDHTVIHPVDFPFNYFRCYEDPNIGLVNLSYNLVACDYIEGITSLDDARIVRTTIFPNPSSNFVTLKTEDLLLDKIFVIDILGKIRTIQHITSFEPLKINISELENGLFFILGRDKNGKTLFVQKITKFGS